MFSFHKKTKMPEKYDDVDWHGGEKAIHIALMFVWLVSRKYVLEDFQEGANEAVSDRKYDPYTILEIYADGKLLASMIDPSVVKFLNAFYETRFLSAVEDDQTLSLRREIGKFPYDIDNSWANVDIASEWLDEQYRLWLKPA